MELIHGQLIENLAIPCYSQGNLTRRRKSGNSNSARYDRSRMELANSKTESELDSQFH